MNTDAVYAAKRKINKINSPKDGSIRTVKPQQVTKERVKFDDKYKRVTLYFELPVYNAIEALYKSRRMNKKTEFINAAIKEYIKNHYKL